MDDVIKKHVFILKQAISKCHDFLLFVQMMRHLHCCTWLCTLERELTSVVCDSYRAFQEERQPWVVIDCNAIPSEEVLVKEDTTIIEPVVETTDAGEGSVTSESEDIKTPLIISAPQDHQIPISEASTKPESETTATEEPEIIKEVTKPSEVSEKIEEPATSSDGEGNVEPGVEKGEEKGEELALTGHQREEHPTA